MASSIHVDRYHVHDCRKNRHRRLHLLVRNSLHRCSINISEPWSRRDVKHIHHNIMPQNCHHKKTPRRKERNKPQRFSAPSSATINAPYPISFRRWPWLGRLWSEHFWRTEGFTINSVMWFPRRHLFVILITMTNLLVRPPQHRHHIRWE